MNDRISLRIFVIYTYVLFWILFAITGLLVYLKAPEIAITVMKNVDAWTSTFVLIILFKKTVSAGNFWEFSKKAISKSNIPGISDPHAAAGHNRHLFNFPADTTQK